MPVGDSIQPHRLYSGRSGRLIAAPTGVVPLRLLLMKCFTLYRISYGGSFCTVSGGLLFDIPVLLFYNVF